MTTVRNLDALLAAVQALSEAQERYGSAFGGLSAAFLARQVCVRLERDFEITGREQS